MGNKTGVRHYFAEGMTTRGYISLLPNMMPSWQRAYVLLGGPGTGKSTLIKVIGLELLDRGYDIDFLRSARDPDSMAGFIMPHKGLTMLDAMEVSPLRWRAPGVVEKFVDFSMFCDERKLENQRPVITKIEDRMQGLQLSLEEELTAELGSLIRNRAHKPHIEKEDLSWILDNAARLKVKREHTGPWPLAENALKLLQKSVVNPYFLHGLTTEGWLNLAPHFLADFDQIRLEGDETLDALDWVLREAQQLGQLIEIVLHPLNPDEVIGIVFPERHLAIWQGNPENLGDQGLERPFSEKLKETLVSWQTNRSQLKGIYMDAVNFDQLDAYRETLLNQILCELQSKG
ncbi:hypothetical protein [Desulfosporosinus metallidurans]|uniref:ATPase component BioM of energizing module of biotin ECF transporter n=1 Tax=Desulfosporosinus metallidurans TaxID=1888891 RepID=A0A1Q8R323_9FIRM|nr:hypothetical protein [Desulfosporosinus metallidurans]OLN33901.1 ATPase component BioM of energizing module of biotin ECF transporter [Desulfosporosinus metallidurans]